MTDTMALLFPYVAVTGDIAVRVAVSFLPEQSAPSAGRWFWSYHVRVENRGTEAVQLLERSWKIVDGQGKVYQVRGEGVVGETPLLAPGQTYDYVSGCELMTNMGSMEGHYTFAAGDGTRFDVAIPFFPLAAPAATQG